MHFNQSKLIFSYEHAALSTFLENNLGFYMNSKKILIVISDLFTNKALFSAPHLCEMT